MKRVAFDWGVSPKYGWGVYGLNLALQWSLEDEVEASTAMPIRMRELEVDAIRLRRLRPFVQRSAPFGSPPADATRLQALGNGLVGNHFVDRPGADVGVVFFEEPLDSEAAARGREYAVLIAGSEWNRELLVDAGLPHVERIWQGVDESLFHPAPRRGLYPDRFLIFSGGKAEPRKGQDLVVKAFRIFADRHDEAMLVTAWHSPWPQLAVGMDLDLARFADRVIDVGHLSNGQMPAVYRECDVGLFPNRAEGGTNLVAMECLACGLPTILSKNTGHRELIGLGDWRRVWPLCEQKPSTVCFGFESDVDEIVDLLEQAFVAFVPPATFPILQGLTWSATAARLLSIVESLE